MEWMQGLVGEQAQRHLCSTAGDRGSLRGSAANVPAIDPGAASSGPETLVPGSGAGRSRPPAAAPGPTALRATDARVAAYMLLRIVARANSPTAQGRARDSSAGRPVVCNAFSALALPRGRRARSPIPRRKTHRPEAGLLPRRIRRSGLRSRSSLGAERKTAP